MDLCCVSNWERMWNAPDKPNISLPLNHSENQKYVYRLMKSANQFAGQCNTDWHDSLTFGNRSCTRF